MSSTVTAASVPTAPEADAPMGRRNWFGLLTIANLPAVADRLSCLLDDRYYTAVSVYEYRGYRPEVRTSQRLRDGITVRTEDDGSRASLSFSDGNFSWMLAATAPTQADAVNQPERDKVRITFGNDYQGERVEIELHTPAGQRAFYTFMVEDHTDY